MDMYEAAEFGHLHKKLLHGDWDTKSVKYRTHYSFVRLVIQTNSQIRNKWPQK